MLEELRKIFGDTIQLSKNVSVDIEKFKQLFSDVEKLTFDELMRVDEENNYGYEKYIEKWKEEGLIE